jgi:hypothetical protein
MENFKIHQKSPPKKSNKFKTFFINLYQNSHDLIYSATENIIFSKFQFSALAHLEAGSVLINILKVAENPKLPSCIFWGKNKGF